MSISYKPLALHSANLDLSAHWGVRKSKVMRKFFSPVAWLLISTVFWGMGASFSIFWPVEAAEAGGLSTAEADIANFTWLSLTMTGGYVLAAAGIGYFARGATRARLTAGLGASMIFWVILGLLVIVGPVVGYQNFAPDLGVLPMSAGLGMVVAGLLHWNDSEKVEV